MVIAPGHSIDRTWWKRDTYAVRFVQPMVTTAYYEPTPDQLCSMPEIETASFQRLRHPSWKVVLGFYVHDALNLELPLGYVMPGWVVGIPGGVLESSPLYHRHDGVMCCWACYAGDATHLSPCRRNCLDLLSDMLGSDS
jgi:hypothetical protein